MGYKEHPVSLTQRSPKFSLGSTPTGKMFIGVHHKEIEIDIFYGGAPQQSKIFIEMQKPDRSLAPIGSVIQGVLINSHGPLLFF